MRGLRKKKSSSRNRREWIGFYSIHLCLGVTKLRLKQHNRSCCMAWEEVLPSNKNQNYCIVQNPCIKIIQGWLESLVRNMSPDHKINLAGQRWAVNDMTPDLVGGKGGLWTAGAVG